MSCPCRECGVTCGKGASDQCTRTRVGFNACTNKAYPSYYSDDNAQAVAQPVAEPVMTQCVLSWPTLATTLMTSAAIAIGNMNTNAEDSLSARAISAQKGGNSGGGPRARALNRDMGVSQTSWHKEVILGRNSVFRVFRLYLWLSDLMLP